MGYESPWKHTSASGDGTNVLFCFSEEKKKKTHPMCGHTMSRGPGLNEKEKASRPLISNSFCCYALPTMMD